MKKYILIIAISICLPTTSESSSILTPIDNHLITSSKKTNTMLNNTATENKLISSTHRSNGLMTSNQTINAIISSKYIDTRITEKTKEISGVDSFKLYIESVLYRNIKDNNVSLNMTKSGKLHINFSSIYSFKTNNGRFNAKLIKDFKKIATGLLIHGDINLIIVAHTDSTGSSPYNSLLSISRKNHVKDWFLDQGLSAKRIHSVNYGEQYPRVENSSSSNREYNRRVDLIFY